MRVFDVRVGFVAIMRRLQAGLSRQLKRIKRRIAGFRAQRGSSNLRWRTTNTDLRDAIFRVNLGYQRARLRDTYGPLRLLTEKPTAIDSPDHIQPWGTKRDNHSNLRFNEKLSAWILPPDLSLLDLGCSGGGQVRSFVEQGTLAVGIEGSDYSMKRLRAEWATIPELLFTADITAPFSILARDGPVLFSVVTLWEVIEHIHRRDLPGLFKNIEQHLAPNGVIIMSVSTTPDTINGVDLHQTVEDSAWWYQTFAELGFRNHPEIVRWFGNDFIRWEANAADSFHVILTRSGESPIHEPRIRKFVERVAQPHALGGKHHAMSRL